MKQILRERQILLESVLHWARLNDEENILLPLGWRVCISQERCAIYDQINVLNELIDPNDARNYIVPQIIEDRIQFILNKINK